MEQVQRTYEVTLTGESEDTFPSVEEVQALGAGQPFTVAARVLGPGHLVIDIHDPRVSVDADGVITFAPGDTVPA